MVADTDKAPAVGARRPQIETLLGKYPDISDEELQILLRWFRKDASARDVAMMSQNQKIAPNYQRFRAEHIDKMTSVDVVKAALFAVILIGTIYAIGYLAT